jgi:hypothetical protein
MAAIQEIKDCDICINQSFTRKDDKLVMVCNAHDKPKECKHFKEAD